MGIDIVAFHEAFFRQNEKLVAGLDYPEQEVKFRPRKARKGAATTVCYVEAPDVVRLRAIDEKFIYFGYQSFEVKERGRGLECYNCGEESSSRTSDQEALCGEIVVKIMKLNLLPKYQSQFAGRRIVTLTELETICFEIEMYQRSMQRFKAERNSNQEKSKNSFQKALNPNQQETFNYVSPAKNVGESDRSNKPHWFKSKFKPKYKQNSDLENEPKFDPEWGNMLNSMAKYFQNKSKNSFMKKGLWLPLMATETVL